MIGFLVQSGIECVSDLLMGSARTRQSQQAWSHRHGDGGKRVQPLWQPH